MCRKCWRKSLNKGSLLYPNPSTDDMTEDELNAMISRQRENLPTWWDQETMMENINGC